MNNAGRQWNVEILRPSARAEQEAFAHRLALAMAGLSSFHPGAPLPLRPVVLSSAQYAGLASIARRLVRLVVDVCRRRAADPRRLAAAMDYPQERLRLLPPSHSKSGWSAAMARPDIIISGGVPKILECNVHSCLGGLTETSRTAELYLASPVGARLRAGSELWAASPLAARRNLLARAARVRGRSGRPRVGVIGRTDKDTGSFPRFLTEAVDDLCAHALPAALIELGDLNVGEDGFLDLDGRRFDIALRLFLTSDCIAEDIDLSPVQAVLQAGNTALLVDDVASLYSCKAVLAWLWEGTGLSETERRFVRRHVAWTAVVADRAVEVDGRRVELLALLEGERASFVLKPFASRRGRGVVVGRLLSEEAWRSALEEAVRNGRMVAQRYVAPDTTPIPFYAPGSEIGVCRVPLLFGPFLLGREPGGCLVRHPATFTEGPITWESGATLTAAVACGPL